MPNTEQISLFCSQIRAKRFSDETLGILESILVSKTVKSSIELRSTLKEFLRSESLSVIHEISQKTADQKLSILEFFVYAFALIGDTESCLALRYEALFLRELSSTSHQWLQVSCEEWLNFAEQSLDNGFHAIARKACDNAQRHLRRNESGDHRADKFFENMRISGEIKRLKDSTMTSAASHSVQAQAAEYLKKKTIQKSKRHYSGNVETRCVASALFINGIKKRNDRKLHEYQTCSRFPMDHTSIQL